MASQPFAAVRAARLGEGQIDIELSVPSTRIARANLAAGEDISVCEGGCNITIPLALPLRGGKAGITAGKPSGETPDATLVAALRRAHRMLSLDASGLPTIAVAPQSPYDRRILRLALLAPDIQRDILTGRQPRSLNLETLMHQDIPLAWADQRQALGFSP